MKKNNFHIYNTCCILFVLFMTVASPLLATQISLGSDVKVIKTDHFDFIFENKSINTAQNIASVAETYYTEITKSLDVPKMNLHIPVSISNESDFVSSDFEFYPANRIILRDAVVTSGDLEVFSNTMRSLFYHELVEVITINIRSPFWQAMSTVFGDILAPEYYNLSKNFRKGVAVSFESANGEGRLNDVFAKHIMQQAKIENCFPSLYEIEGSRDIYPELRLPYIFGGAFSLYLQKKYGSEKYAEFWNICGSLHLFTGYDTILEQVYEKPVDELWNEFYNSIDVPENIIKPQKSNLQNVPTYFFPQNLATSKTSNGLPFLLWQDKYSSTIYCSIKNTSSNFYNTQKLFSSVLNERISISNSGNFFTVSGLTNEENPKNSTQIFTLSISSDSTHKITTKYTGISIPKLRDAIIISNSDISENVQKSTDVYVAGVETFLQNSYLIIYKVNIHDKTITEFSRMNFESNYVPLTPVQISNDKILYVLKDGLKTNLVVSNLSFKKNYIFKTGLNIRDISASDDTILFSCAQEKEGYPIYASLSVAELLSACDNSSTIMLSLYEHAYSGGVYEPVLCDNNDIFYVSQFFESWQLSILDKKVQKKSVKKILQAQKFTLFESSIETNTFTTESYNPLRYIADGILFPLAGFNINTSTYSGPMNFPSLGLSWFTVDPLERYLGFAATGYDFINNDVTTNFSAQNISTSTDNTNNSWNVDTALNFNTSEITKAFAEINVERQQFLGLSYWYVYGKTCFDYCYNINDSNIFDFFDIPKENFVIHYSQVSFGYKKSTGQIPFQYLNFATCIGFEQKYDFMEENYSPDFGVGGTVHLPQLLPITKSAFLTINLPTTLSLMYFLPYENTNSRYEWESTFILFSKEIQKEMSLLVIGAYNRRIIIDAGCDGIFYDKKNQDITFHTAIYSTFDKMVFTFNLGIEFFYCPFDDKKPFSLSLKFDL